MATSLLCSLDGSAHSLLSELDDAGNASYSGIKELLTKRFSPVRHTEVHEQALQEIRLARGQSSRELTPEILRLSKLTYPDCGANACNRMAIKALINAVTDKDAVFYIKDKSPTTLDDVCSFYKRYRVLTGRGQPRAAVKGVKFAEGRDSDHQDEAVTSLRRQCDHTDQQLQQLASAVNQQSENTAQQFQQLISTVTQLLVARPAEPAPAPQPHPRGRPRLRHSSQPPTMGKSQGSRADAAINWGIGINTAHNRHSTSSRHASTDPAQRLR